MGRHRKAKRVGKLKRKIMSRIPCQCCGREYPLFWNWFICNKCNYRICGFCLNDHKGNYGNGGYKCSQCAFGQMKLQKGV